MPLMTITKPRQKRCVHQPAEAPFPIPIETITHKPATNRHWFFYQAQMIDNNVIVQNEGDIAFLSKMGFFGKGILSRSKPEHQFFASSFQGSYRKNLPPKERRFQQQRFQQVRQHKYERHLSWQKQLLLQRKQRGEVKEKKTTEMSEDSVQNPSYRVPTIPAKRVKRATISERNQRAGIMTTDRRRERPGTRLVPESEEVSMESSQPDIDSKRIAHEDVPVSSAKHFVRPPHLTTVQRVMPSRDGIVTVDADGAGRIKSPRSLSREEIKSRQEVEDSCRLHGTHDSEESKFVFQSQATGVRHTSSYCEPFSSCLFHSDQDRSGHPDMSEKMSSTGHSESMWETRHADWVDCMEVGSKGQGDNKDLAGSSRNTTSAWSMSSWRTDPKEWDQVAKTKSPAHPQSGHKQQEISDRDNIGPSQMTESESIHGGAHDRVTDGATTTGSYTSTSALGMDQTSIEGEKKRSSGHPSWSEGWTSDPRDWDMGEGDQTLIHVSKTLGQDHRDSEVDPGFDDNYEVSEQQNLEVVSESNKFHQEGDVFVSDPRNDKHRGNHCDRMEPSTSKSSHFASCRTVSEVQLLHEGMDRDYASNNPEHLPENIQKENVGTSHDCIMDFSEEDRIQKSQRSQESSKTRERDSDCNHSNADDAFVAVPTPVEFEDATTSQTESNNILSLKGRDARKKIREVKTGPVRHKDPYPIFEYLQLSYEEAFFLSYGLGCLNLKSANKNQMDLTEMWRTFRRHQPSFVANYIVYHFFRSKGWVPKTGLKFGADFILYKKGPPFFHASYCVYVSMINEEDIDHQGVHKMNWASLMGMDRVIENAAKELMFCFVIKPSKLRQKDLDSPACIPHFKVQEMMMKRWVPSRGRQQGQLEEEVS